MNEAVKRMLAQYHCSTTRNTVTALREILQEIVLLGLWRSKFFEHAIFYGETALRILYGLDRFSEDLDFSLLKADKAFDPGKYATALEEEVYGFGFDIQVEQREKSHTSAITRNCTLPTWNNVCSKVDIYPRRPHWTKICFLQYLCSRLIILTSARPVRMQPYLSKTTMRLKFGRRISFNRLRRAYNLCKKYQG